MEKEKQIWIYRWMAEKTAFSSIKRMFGEYVMATRFQIGKRDDVEGIPVQPIYKNGIKKMKIG
jgi:hypothetical protein